ncbi:Potassium channel [Orbilia oligospora]|uniref:Potassium channel n=2 Tax=Orbilia oligospora TaxID=2813651 RepID=A0A7C8NR11_ORBOL|nr:Potassium channel [Orbilia oligospora]KAF3101933.1 Potassium channel [Orbilia oligospora]
MYQLRTQLLGEAFTAGRRSSTYRQTSPSSASRRSQNESDTDVAIDPSLTPNLGLESTPENSSSEPSSSKSAPLDTSNDDGRQSENIDEAEGLEDYEEEFQRHDEPPIKWWFAAKGIPLIAATVGPLANLTSVAALVSPWRADLMLEGDHPYDQRYDLPFPDPRWAIGINAASLVFGFIGNFFLMCNYSRRIRYAVAMPFTIICWFIAFGLLSSILAALHVYARPVSPGQIYTQAFWFGVISASLYLFSASILFINIAGFLKKHYPAHIESSRAEKNLMLQTIFFFLWMGIGALVFSKVEGWSYSDAVYFCNVTLLTVGFGDIAATSDAARGIVFPFSVVGIIMLGLVVNSIHGFVIEIGEKQVVEQHITNRRRDVANRAVAVSSELDRDDPSLAHFQAPITSPISPTGATVHRRTTDSSIKSETIPLRHSGSLRHIPQQIFTAFTSKRRSRPILLRASRDRFEAMRRIQRHTLKFKKWTALVSSTVAFLTLWLLGAVIFMIAEKDTQGLTYFQALYFCYVSLLTIGYGDLSPRSNAGKAFFLLWSIWSVPTITILISSMGSTVIENFQNATLRLAEFTILPKEGIRKSLKEMWRNRKARRKEERLRKERLRNPSLATNTSHSGGNGSIARRGSRAISSGNSGLLPPLVRMPTLKEVKTQDRDSTLPSHRGPPIPIPTFALNDSDIEEQRLEDNQQQSLSIRPELLEKPKPLPEDYTFQELLAALTAAIRDVGRQVATDPKRAYEYTEWVEFTRLIRACELVKPQKLKGLKPGEEILREHIDNDEGFVLWDWIGEDSPLLYEGNEPAWVQDRLTKGLEDLVTEHLKNISLDVPK